MTTINPEKKKVLETIWAEIKKINWNEINARSKKKFSLSIIGNETFINMIQLELKKTYGMETIAHSFGTRFKAKQNVDASLFKNLLICIDEADIESKTGLIKTSDICIVSEEYFEKVRELNLNAYCFEGDFKELIEMIVNNNEEILPALSFCFPCFRVLAANRAIQKVALQNVVWVVGTAFPNLIPGPHQPVTAVVEGVSDFVALTTNEFRMMLEIVGLSGSIVSPFKIIVEVGFIYGLANGAKWVATQIVGKAPAGTGLFVKGGVAFAFTHAIGQTVLLYQLTGKKTSVKGFIAGFKEIYTESRNFIKNFIEERIKKTSE